MCTRSKPSDVLGEQFGRHIAGCASHVGERHDFTRDQVAQEFCCAKNVLRLLERDRIKGHSYSRLRVGRDDARTTGRDAKVHEQLAHKDDMHQRNDAMTL